MSSERRKEQEAAPNYKAAMRSLPIAELSPDLTPGSESYSKLGDISLGQGAWGTYISNQQIIESLVHFGLVEYGSQEIDDIESDPLVRKIRSLGFEGGYYTPFHVNVYDEQFQTEYIPPLAADVLEKTLKARGVDGLSRLYIGSQTLTNAAREAIVAKLKERGITIEESTDTLEGVGDSADLLNPVQSHEMVCQSPTDILNASFSDDRLKGKLYAALCIELTTGHLSHLDDPSNIAVFGNNISTIVLKGGEIELVNGGRSIVEYDPNGAITSPNIHGLPDESERIATPDRYVVIGDYTNGHFMVTRNGVTLLLPDTEFLQMDGMKALGTFTGNSVINEIVDVEFEYYETPKLKRESDTNGIATGHQPSKGVLIGGIERKVIRTALLRKGVAIKKVREISKSYHALTNEEKGEICRQYHIPYINYRWIMDKLGKNNGSSSTTLAALEYQIREEMIKIGDVCTALGLGAGFSYSVAKWRLNGFV